MKFSTLSEYLEELEKTASRLKITQILADLFNKTTKDEIDKTVYLLLGNLAPSYKGVVFNIAERMMLQALAKAYSITEDEVKFLYKKKGDFGEVVTVLAQKRKKKSKKELSIIDVYKSLYDIAEDEGEGSQERKIDKMAALINKLDSSSGKFVVRIPLGKLRLGFSDKTILDALSWMEKGDKSAKSKLESAYNMLPDVGHLAKMVKENGADKATKNVAPKVGIPVLPMLAQRLKSPTEMIEKMEKVSVEPKFDGLRIQIHFSKGNILAFTRNLNETSWMFPELEGIAKYINAKNVILDTEAIGVDEKRKTLANFQTTMTRRRKHEISEIAKKVSIKFYCFDILLKNGKNLMKLPYKKRREILEKTVKSGKIIEKVSYKITEDSRVIVKDMSKLLSEGLEGVIVKKADSTYVAGRTGWRWVKMKEKESSLAKLADTIDCIVMGYYSGKGKRTKFGLGGFLVGVGDKGKIKTLTKIGTGLTDNQFLRLKKKLTDLETDKKPKEYGDVGKNIIPDVWVEPGLVVEIAADEITKSPIHSSGFALRFPRLVKFRDDKNKGQATTIKEVKDIFNI